jgi:hypothetical protein
MMALFILMQQQNQQLQMQMQQQTQQLADSNANCRITAPSVLCPKWDGTNATIPAFIKQLKTLMQDCFFRGADWTCKAQGFDNQSTWLCLQMLQILPQQKLNRFMHRPDFEDNGFAMFAHLMACLQPNDLVHILQDVIALGNLEHLPNQEASAYIAECRRIFNSLQHVSVVQLIPLLMLCCLDPDQFTGIRRSLEQGNPSLINVTLEEIEECVL